MNTAVMIAIVLFVIFEAIFLFFVYRTVKSSRELKEVNLAQFDSERREILAIQRKLRTDSEAAQALSKETIGRLQEIGLQAHAEWTEMTSKIDDVVAEVENRSAHLSHQVLKEINKKQLECRKIVDNAEKTLNALNESVSSAKRVTALLASHGGVEDILREIQMEKYQEAKRRLLSGASPEQVSTSLGLTKAEISLVSHSI